jgi:hypothetical protein
MKLFEGKTLFNAKAEQVGPGFYSLGAPTVLRNLFRWKADLSQTAWEGKIRFSLYAGVDDNSADKIISIYQSQILSYGMTFSIRPPKLPFFSLTYAPYKQETMVSGNALTEVNDESDMLNMQAGHSYKIGELPNGSTFIGFISQSYSSSDAFSSDFKTSIFSLTQTIIYGSANTTIGFTHAPNQVIGNQSYKITTLNLSGGFTALEKWTNTVGLQYFNQKDIDKKTGFFWSSSYPVMPWATLTFRIQKNIYKDTGGLNPFDETLAWLGVNVRW